MKDTDDIRKPTQTPEESKRLWRVANAQYNLEKMPLAVTSLICLLKILVRFHPCPQAVFDTFEEAYIEYEKEYKLIKIILENELKVKNEDR